MGVVKSILYHLRARAIEGGSIVPILIAGGTVKAQLVTDALTGQATSTDDITNALTIIPVVHHEVHEGEMFTASYLDLSIADNADIEVLLRTGNKYTHLFFFTSCGGDAEIELVENPTVNDQGTPLTEWNNKRTSAETAETNAFHSPNVAAGDVILEAVLAGGTGGNSSGGLLRTDSEFILKTSQDYVIRVTNRAGNAQPASIVVNWYEESDN